MALTVPDTFIAAKEEPLFQNRLIKEANSANTGKGESIARIGFNINHVGMRSSSAITVAGYEAVFSSGSYVEVDRLRYRRSAFCDNINFRAKYYGDGNSPAGDIYFRFTDVTNGKSVEVSATIPATTSTTDTTSVVLFAAPYLTSVAADESIDIQVEARVDTYGGSVSYIGCDIWDDDTATTLGSVIEYSGEDGSFVGHDDGELVDGCPVSVYHLKQMAEDLLFIQKRQNYVVTTRDYHENPSIPAADRTLYATDQNGNRLVDGENEWHSRCVAEIPYRPRRGTGYVDVTFGYENTESDINALWIRSSASDRVLHRVKYDGSNLLKHHYRFFDSEIANTTRVNDETGDNAMVSFGTARTFRSVPPEPAEPYGFARSSVGSYWHVPEIVDNLIDNNTWIRATGMNPGAWSFLVNLKIGAPLSADRNIFDIKDGATTLFRLFLNNAADAIGVEYNGTHNSSLSVSGDIGLGSFTVQVSHDGVNTLTLRYVDRGSFTMVEDTFAVAPPDYTSNIIDSIRLLDGNVDESIYSCEMWHDEHTAAEHEAMYDALRAAIGDDFNQGNPVVRTYWLQDTRTPDSDESWTLNAPISGEATRTLRVKKFGLDRIRFYTGRRFSSSNPDVAIGYGGGRSGMNITKIFIREVDAP